MILQPPMPMSMLALALELLAMDELSMPEPMSMPEWSIREVRVVKWWVVEGEKDLTRGRLAAARA